MKVILSSLQSQNYSTSDIDKKFKKCLTNKNKKKIGITLHLMRVICAKLHGFCEIKKKGMKNNINN